jgi:hypothetical protein
MTKISYSSLKELTRIMAFANTPRSLFRAILASRAYDCLSRGSDYGELNSYYDAITSRGKRSPVVAALAYAVLIALLVKTPNSGAVDSTRLEWGERIAEYTNQTQKSSQIIILKAPDWHSPKISSTFSNGITLVKAQKQLPPNNPKIIKI